MQTILFDLDGTLIDSQADIAASANHVRVALGREALPEGVVANYVGDGLAKLLERCFAGEDVDLERATQVFLAHYREHPVDRTVLYEGVREMLEALTSSRLAVISNKPEELCRVVLESLGVAGRFARVAGGDTYPTRKPAPEPILSLLSELDSRSEDGVIVGDAHQDIRAGKAAGIFTVAVTWGFHPRERLVAEEPDVIVDSVGALCEVLLDLARRRT